MNPPETPPHESSLATSVLERVKQHEPAAWDRLTKLFAPLVYAWVRRGGVREADAADVVQDVFLDIARSISRFHRTRENGSFTGWVRTIAQRRIADHFRRNLDPVPAGGTAARRFLEGTPESIPEGSSCLEPDDSPARLVRGGLDLIRGEFEERTWKAFARTALEHRPAAEVAAELSMSVGAVYVAKSRVTKRLREELDGLV